MSLRTLVVLFSLMAIVSCKDGINKQSDKADTSEVEPKVEEQQVLQGKHPSEDSIVFYLSEIERMNYGGDYDSLSGLNVSLMRNVKAVCQDETSLSYAFEISKKAGMNVLTSEDKKFRIYCWDTWTGGSMHFYDAIVQYKTKTGSKGYILNDIAVSHDDGGDCGVWYDTLYTVNTNSGMVYMSVYFGRFSGIEYGNGICAFSIKDDKINKPQIFKPKGKPLSEIFYDFTIGTENKESRDNKISLSADKKTLSIPITDKDRVVTEKSLIYNFDGDKFVYDKNAR